jgi:hypothetical protein
MGDFFVKRGGRALLVLGIVTALASQTKPTIGGTPSNEERENPRTMAAAKLLVTPTSRISIQLLSDALAVRRENHAAAVCSNRAAHERDEHALFETGEGAGQARTSCAKLSARDVAERANGIAAYLGVPGAVVAILPLGGTFLGPPQIALRLPAPYLGNQFGIAHIGAPSTGDALLKSSGQDGGL